MKNLCGFLVAGLMLASCARTGGDSLLLPFSETPSFTAPAESIPNNLSEDKISTLKSLVLVDDHPLYTMQYVGDYNQRGSTSLPPRTTSDGWACSLFAAFADPGNMIFGRNFDWDYSPALLLFTHPADGYASVSMVDIEFLGFNGGKALNLNEAPLADRVGLLDAPDLPFDGMNEKGLAVGMAAVPPGNMEIDPDKPEIGSLGVIREMLDHAANVDEAVNILGRYNVLMEGGPPIHYLIADASGKSSLVEFYEGEMVVEESGASWLAATNFLLAAGGGHPEGNCWRYDLLTSRLNEADGLLSVENGMKLLSDVAQDGTQWSVVYNVSTGEVHVVMGRDYDNPHILRLDLWAPDFGIQE